MAEAGESLTSGPFPEEEGLSIVEVLRHLGEPKQTAAYDAAAADLQNARSTLECERAKLRAEAAEAALLKRFETECVAQPPVCYARRGSPTGAWEPLKVGPVQRSGLRGPFTQHFHMLFKRPLDQSPSRLLVGPIEYFDARFWLAETIDVSAAAPVESGAPAVPLSVPSVSKTEVDDFVRGVIREVYNEAGEAGKKPPNINELPGLVRPRMANHGYAVTGERIKDIGDELEFRARRQPRGTRWRGKV